jgi:ribosomal protein S18 acetylase RimI-like enzyme
MSSAPLPASPGKGGSKRASAPTPATTSESPSVRRARASDIDHLVELEHRCFSDEDRFPRATWRRLIGVATQQGKAQVLVIEGVGLAAAIVGLVKSGGKTARIYSLAVDPACRGRGLAGILMTALARRVLKRGCNAMSLEVRADNQAALGLYQKVGFTVVAELPGYYAGTDPGLRLKVPLRTYLELSARR